MILEILGFIIIGIGALLYCSRTNTFFFYPGMKYHSATKIEAFLFVLGMLLMMLSIFEGYF